MKLRLWLQRSRYKIEVRVNGKLIAAGNSFHVNHDDQGVHIFVPTSGKYLEDLSLTQPKDVPPKSSAANFMRTMGPCR